MSELQTMGQGDVAKQLPPLDFDEIGRTGLVHTSGFVREEFLRELQGRRGMRLYREMKDNDDIVGAMLYAIKSLARGVKWTVKPFDPNVPKDVENAEFVEQALFLDMEQTWPDCISETLSMLWAGWAWQEMVFKRRIGPLETDPTRQSFFTDGRIGFRKLAIRAQESLFRWALTDEGDIEGMIQTAAPNYLATFIPAERSLLFRTETERNNPEGRSILRNAYRSWLFKKHIQETEGIGIERDLAGYPVLTVEEDGPDIWNTTNADAVTQKANLVKLYKSIRRDSQEGILKPWWLKVELLSTTGKRQFDTSKIVTRYDQRIAMTVVADFILIGHEAVGSKALSVSKVRLFSNSLRGFLTAIASIHNRRSIPTLMAFNGLPLDRLPKLEPGKTEDIDLQGISEYLKDLVGAGADLFPDQVLEEHLLTEANLPFTPDRERGAPGVDELKLMIEELKASLRDGARRAAPGTELPPGMTLDGKAASNLTKLIGAALVGTRVRDDEILALAGAARELQPLMDGGETAEVAKGLSAIVKRVEQLIAKK